MLRNLTRDTDKEAYLISYSDELVARAQSPVSVNILALAVAVDNPDARVWMLKKCIHTLLADGFLVPAGNDGTFDTMLVQAKGGLK